MTNEITGFIQAVNLVNDFASAVKRFRAYAVALEGQAPMPTPAELIELRDLGNRLVGPYTTEPEL